MMSSLVNTLTSAGISKFSFRLIRKRPTVIQEDGIEPVYKGSAEIAKVAYEAATEDLLNQAPNLKNYTFDPNVIGPYLLQQENLKSTLYFVAGSSKDTQRDYIADCFSQKDRRLKG